MPKTVPKFKEPLIFGYYIHARPELGEIKWQWSDQRKQFWEDWIPKDKDLKILAKTAQISLEKPNFNVFLKLNNGNVILNPDQILDYEYKFEIDNGHMDQFDSNGTNSGYKMNFNLKNGSILKKDI